MTWHAARERVGHLVHIWMENGVGREGNTPGGFTREIQSPLPVSKKKKRREGRERKNINWSVKNKGGKGELYLPLYEPPLPNPFCESPHFLPLCFLLYSKPCLSRFFFHSVFLNFSFFLFCYFSFFLSVFFLSFFLHLLCI